MVRIVKISEVCTEIFAGGDVPKNNMSVQMTDEFSVPIYSNGEAQNGLYGYTNFARVKEPSITISARGTIGYAAIRNEPFVPIVRLISLTPNKNLVDIRYLYYAVQNYHFNGSGTSIPQLTVPMLKEYTFPLPEMDKQQHIASVLDKITDLISLRNQQLAKLDELVKARFVEMFGNPVCNTKRLPTKRLAVLGSLDRGRSKHRPRNDPALLNGPYPLIQTGEVASSGLYITSYKNTYSEFGLKQSKMWDKGTLCITIAANIAQTAILSFDACFPDSVVGFVPNGEVSAVYMHYWFSFFQKILEEQAPQVAQKNINLQILSDLDVMIPPEEKQNEFSVFVEKTEKSKLTIQKDLDIMKTLRKVITKEYF